LKPGADDQGGRVGDSSLPRARNAEEAFEVTAGDFEEVGGGEAEGAKEASGVAGKVKREMAGAGRRDASEGEILEENTEFFVMCVIGGRWKAGSGRRIVDDGDGGVGPSGGGGGEAEGEFDVVPEGEHVGAGRAGAEPGRAIDEQARTYAPGHRIAAGDQGLGLFEVLANRPKRPGQEPRDRLGYLLKLAGGIDQKRSDGASRVFVCGGEEGFEVFGGQDGVVIHHEEMGEVGKLSEGPFGGGGESAPEAEVLAG
jgi:hypothetical protein